jgi:hypothetical protein
MIAERRFERPAGHSKKAQLQQIPPCPEEHCETIAALP